MSEGGVGGKEGDDDAMAHGHRLDSRVQKERVLNSIAIAMPLQANRSTNRHFSVSFTWWPGPTPVS